MDSLLECSICFEKYNRLRKMPRILKCGHTFCQGCLESFNGSNILNEQTIICLIDKQKNTNVHSINDIPINRLIIDILEIDKENSSNGNSNHNYMTTAKEKLKSITESYSTSLASIRDNKTKFINAKNDSLKEIVEYYDAIINSTMNHKEYLTQLLESFSNQKIDSYNNMIKILEQFIQLGQNGLKKIDALRNNNKKKLSIPEELNFISGLGFESLEDKALIKNLNGILNEFKGGFYPEIAINDPNHIDTIFREKTLNNLTLKITNEDKVIGLNSLIDNINLNNSEIEDSFLVNSQPVAYFLWFQQNTPNVYLKQFSEDNESEWEPQPNKTNFILNEMFRVCQINQYEALITGGIDDTTILNTTILYSKGIFTKKQNMFYERRTHAMCKVDDMIYVCGGINIKNEPIKFCEKYSLQYEKWVKITSMLNEKSHMTLCSINNHHIYSFGGENKYENLLDIIERYSILNELWELLKVRLPIKIECCACVKKSQREISIMGGYNNLYGPLDIILSFDTIELKIEAKHATLSKSGWSVFNPIKQNNICHIFFGGEESSTPTHIKFELY